MPLESSPLAPVLQLELIRDGDPGRAAPVGPGRCHVRSLAEVGGSLTESRGGSGAARALANGGGGSLEDMTSFGYNSPWKIWPALDIRIPGR